MAAPPVLPCARAWPAKAYARTAAYDAAISTGSPRRSTTMATTTAAPPAVWRPAAPGVCAMAKTRIRRPAFYVNGDQRPGVATAKQLQGKELSYNNINDTDAAYRAGRRIRSGAQRPPSPSSSTPILAAWPMAAPRRTPIARRWPAIRSRAFGGIVALNRTLDADAARGDRQDLHRSDHRARRRRRGQGDHRRQEESAAAARRRPARPARRRPHRPAPSPAASSCRRATMRCVDDLDAQGRDQARADASRNWPICVSPSAWPSTSSRTPSSMPRTAPRSASAPAR